MQTQQWRHRDEKKKREVIFDFIKAIINFKNNWNYLNNHLSHVKSSKPLARFAIIFWSVCVCAVDIGAARVL